MLNLEDGNVSKRSRLGTFLHSKTGLGIIGVIALAVAPTAAFALDSFGSQDTPATSLDTSFSTSATTSNSLPVEPTSLETTVNTNSSGNNSSTQVTVNGQEVTVPENGSVHKTIADDNGKTTVDVTSTRTGTASNVQINSFSSNVSSSVHSETKQSTGDSTP